MTIDPAIMIIVIASAAILTLLWRIAGLADRLHDTIAERDELAARLAKFTGKRPRDAKGRFVKGKSS